MSKKLLLIDGLSILHRTFYGLPDLTNSEGLHTGAVYGFINILYRLLQEEQPDSLIIAFDVSAPTFRHKLFEAYKGTRKPMPEELRQQIPLIKEVLDAMGVCRYEQAGLEADDILGTLARNGEADGYDVTLVSGDRDLLQIATEKIMITIPKTQRGGTEIFRYHAEDVKAEWGVTPEQFIELKALMGDTADNIPGVPRVGEKTAKELMTTYGSIEEIYAHLEEISKKSIRESLAANRDLCDLSKTLATIKTDAELSITPADAAVKDYDTRECYELFQRLNFRNFLSRFDSSKTENRAELSCTLIEDLAAAEDLLTAVEKNAIAHPEQFVGFALMEDSTEAGGLVGVGICAEEGKAYFLKQGGMLTEDYLEKRLTAMGEHVRFSGFDLKNTYHRIRPYDAEHPEREAGAFDILVAAYLLNPLVSDYQPEQIASEYLQLTVQNREMQFGKLPISMAPVSALTEYAGYQAYIAFAAAAKLEARLEAENMLRLMRSIEMPLTYILFDMEQEGMRCDREQLREYGEQLTGRIQELENSIHEAAGEDFNIQSPKQLGEILFDKMKLPGGKKTKTGYSTAADVLEKLAPEVPFVADVLEYRALTKLKSTYADGLAAFIGEDGRIHTTLHQTITATGRISSTEPNLQNIPMRTELGRAIRKVFIPKEGYLFTDADYSQIELRILAHMSKDSDLIRAYHEGRDIHRITASHVFHTPFEEVTPQQRRNAKAVNFGIVYGISAFGLSNDLSISRAEAKEYMDEYFEAYPGVQEYQKHAVEGAKEKGYSETLYGRRRPIPELKESNFMRRAFGERVAMNAPIQGTAADIIKIAMIRVYRRLKSENLKSKMILQIHDELLIETAADEQEQVSKLLIEEMQNAADLMVPLEVDCHTAADWYDAH